MFKIFFIIILIFGFFFRIFNLNFDDFWIDEMVSFWISDPDITMQSTINRMFDSGNYNFLYEIFLKFFFQITNYKIENARYITSIFSCAALISSSYLAYIIGGKKVSLFFLFLVSINIYLIKYSFELRYYSLAVFLSSILLIYFKKFLDKKSNSNLYITFFFGVLCILTHLYLALILISIFAYSIAICLKQKKIESKFFILNFLNFFFLFTYLLILFPIYKSFTDMGAHSYIPEIKPSFFTNFYFSKFFGSRIVGTLHLVIFIYLVYNFRKKIFSESYLNFIILLIFISYFLTILTSIIYKPVVQDRYLIFLLIPLIVVITNLTFELNNFKKNLFFFLLISSNLLNFLTEQTFKQFFFTKYKTKPDFESVFKKIDKSNYKNFTFKLKDSNYFKINDVQENYIQHYLIKKNPSIKYLKDINLKKKYFIFWVICIPDVHNKDCELPEKMMKYKILDDYNFNRINLKLISKLRV